MTICEYIREKYNEYIKTPDKSKCVLINPELKGTYEYFKLFCEYVCGGGYDYQLKNAGITQEQIDEAIENKYIKKKSYTNWEARMKGQTTLYLLTVKGMKTIYNYYKEWQVV